VRSAIVAGVVATVGIGAALVLWPRHADTTAPECATGPTVAGIDVSYYQETIDWYRVQRAGIRFAFIRVSDGATLHDTMFDVNWAEARRVGIVRGAYQFFRPEQSVIAQADLMIAAMRHRHGDDLPPVLDVEVDGGLSPKLVAARAHDWVERVRDRLGVEPIVYTGNDLWRDVGAGPLGNQPLWLAHYTANCPMIPAPWTAWTFWQHTDHGSVPGIVGNVDLDLFAGTPGDLRAGVGALARGPR
jgi:lysozyme